MILTKQIHEHFCPGTVPPTARLNPRDPASLLPSKTVLITYIPFPQEPQQPYKRACRRHRLPLLAPTQPSHAV